MQSLSLPLGDCGCLGVFWGVGGLLCFNYCYGEVGGRRQEDREHVEGKETRGVCGPRDLVVPTSDHM